MRQPTGRLILFSVVFAMEVLLLSCNTENEGNANIRTKLGKVERKPGVRYFADFDLLAFRGVNEMTEPRYPFVEYEETNPKRVRLKFCLSERRYTEDYYEIGDGFVSQSDTSSPDGEFLEYNHVFIHEGKLYNYIYNFDTLTNKGEPSEFFLDYYSEFDGTTRTTYVLHYPFEESEIFLPAIKPRNFSLKIPEKLISSVSEEKWEKKGRRLVYSDKTVFSSSQKTIRGEMECYDMHGLSWSWQYYLGWFFKVDC